MDSLSILGKVFERNLLNSSDISPRLLKTKGVYFKPSRWASIWAESATSGGEALSLQYRN